MIDRDVAEAVILDHDARPRNYGELPGATHAALGYNPLCGDKYTVSVRLASERLEAVRFHGFGCALSKSSASVMTEILEGLTRHAALEVTRILRDGLAHGTTVPEELAHLLLAGEHPARRRCALLAWEALEEALGKD